jgi:hypothetical protein
MNGKKETYIQSFKGVLKKRNSMEYIDVDARIILKYVIYMGIY